MSKVLCLVGQISLHFALQATISEILRKTDIPIWPPAAILDAPSCYSYNTVTIIMINNFCHRNGRQIAKNCFIKNLKKTNKPIVVLGHNNFVAEPRPMDGGSSQLDATWTGSFSLCSFKHRSISGKHRLISSPTSGCNQ